MMKKNKTLIVAALAAAAGLMVAAGVAEAAYRCTGNCSGRGGGYRHCHCVWIP